MIRTLVRLGAIGLATAALAVTVIVAAPFVVSRPAAGAELQRVEAWLDAPIPTDAAPGTTVTIGATIWQATDNAPFVLQSIVFEPYDRSDPETPLEPVRAPQDWPGHYSADLVIPGGGLDHVVVGLFGGTCDENGACVPGVLAFDEGGVGPPPGAPLPAIADLTVDVLTTPAVAGEPVDVELVLEHRAAWSRELAPLPEQLVVMVRPPREPPVAEVAAVLVDADTGRYAASITADEPGDYVLDAATDPETTNGDVFTSSTQRISLEAPEAAPAPVDETPGPDLLLIAVVAGAAAVIGLLGFVAIRRLG